MQETPLGPMLAGAVDDGISLLEFTDRPMLPTQLAVLEQRLGRPLVAGRHQMLDRLATQLTDYFAGRRDTFDLPLIAPGSPFQERTWATLRGIPLGATLTYEQLASGAGRPGAQRAAGTANGANRIAVLIPCHRVIRKSGEVGGYGGGSWRKAWLLDHERSVAAPAVAASTARSCEWPYDRWSRASRLKSAVRGRFATSSSGVAPGRHDDTGSAVIRPL
jgi:AraC family transcriptional regulator of adaptative response/methylated-DNA-[protein]-cysteine methyltransferase